MTRPDFIVVNHGTIVGLTANTRVARRWVRENCQTEGWQWIGNTLHVEPRCVDQILDAAMEDGLTVA